MGEARRRYEARDGVARTLIIDDDTPDRFHVLTQQDIEPILEGIARDRETMRHGVNKLAARLPLFIYEDLLHRGIIGDEDAFKKWLNGPAAAPWRVWRGRV
jgi:hypothetical protein